MLTFFASKLIATVTSAGVLQLLGWTVTAEAPRDRGDRDPVGQDPGTAGTQPAGQPAAGDQQPQDPLAGSDIGNETTTYVDETFRFLNAPQGWVLALIIVPATVLFAWWSYSGLNRLEQPTRILLSVLRWLAISFCVLLLCQPAFEITKYRKTRNQVHVLIDDSASMSRKDRYPAPEQSESLQQWTGPIELSTKTRTDLVRMVLDDERGLLPQLRKTHDVRLFRVENKPTAIRSIEELSARGNRTALGNALDLHLQSASGANLDAVILVSDGRNNAGLDPVEVANNYGVRGITVHTIGVGDPEPPRNAWLVGPPGPEEALREEQVGFDVTVRAEGLAGERARVELRGSRDGGPFRTLATASDVLPAPGESAKLRITHAFDEAGDWTLKFTLAPLEQESQLDDNEDIRFLRVNDERIRVLFLDDRPRWEYRYVKNALKRVDPSIHMQAILFDASPRFIQEHSDDLRPLRDLPRTPNEMLKYHVILIGVVPPERIAANEEGRRQWLQMLVEFVEFGGGVGFLFGDAAMPERYRNTLEQDLLPVVLEDPSWLANNKPTRDKAFRARLENPTNPHEILMLQRDPSFNRRLVPSLIDGRIRGHDNALACVVNRQPLPYLLGDKGHDWMQQPGDTV